MERSLAPLQGWLGGLARRLPRDWGVAVTALLALLMAAYVVGFVAGWGSPEVRTKVTYALYLPLTFGPMLLAWRVAHRRSLPPATRRAWWRLGVGLAGWFIANVGWLWFEAIRGVETPPVVDVVYLTAAGVMLFGLLALPGRQRSHEEQLRLALDVGVAAAFVAIWYLVLGPATTTGDARLMTVLLSVAYPVTDLVLVFGIVTAMLRGTPASSGGQGAGRGHGGARAGRRPAAPAHPQSRRRRLAGLRGPRRPAPPRRHGAVRGQAARPRPGCHLVGQRPGLAGGRLTLASHRHALYGL
jgi:hypothetical protein